MIRSLRLRFFLIMWPLVVIAVGAVAWSFSRWTRFELDEIMTRQVAMPDAALEILIDSVDAARGTLLAHAAPSQVNPRLTAWLAVAGLDGDAVVVAPANVPITSTNDLTAPANDLITTTDERTAPANDLPATTDEGITPANDLTATTDEGITPANDLTATTDERTAPANDLIATTDESLAVVTWPSGPDGLAEFERGVGGMISARELIRISGIGVGPDPAQPELWLYFFPPSDALADDGIMPLIREDARRTIWLAVLLAAAVSAAAALLLAGPMIRQVTRLAQGAEAVQKGDFATRVALSSRDEFGQLEGSFNAMAEALESAESMKRNLVSDVAHELRTPLTNLVGTLEAIQDGLRSADPETIASLREEAALLSTLVEELQELALAESGQLVYDIVELDATAEAASALAAATVVAEGITIVGPTPADPPLLVWADAHRLRQVLGNLIRNAITHTPAGGTVTVSVTGNGTRQASGAFAGKGAGSAVGTVAGGATGSVAGNAVGTVAGGATGSVAGNAVGTVAGSATRTVAGSAIGTATGKGAGNAIGDRRPADDGVIFEITDTGSGIPPEHLNLVFERFHRVDPSRDRASGGMGLGLAIVRQLVAAMDGRIEVTSEVGVGSRFRVVLPRG